MADQPMTNGPAEGQGGKYIDTIDPDDPEYIKQMRRPAEVKEDMNQMENRKRVNLILNSQAFRDELEQMVDEQIKSGSNPSSIRALQQLSEMLQPQYRQGPAGNFGKGTGSVIPIADLRGVDSMNYSKGEKLLRCKLASLYRLIDLFGWAQNVQYQGTVTSRISQDVEHFLTAPYGLLYHEVTAASMVKLDMQGDVLETGSTPSLGINRNSFLLNAAIHAARPDIRCIIHLRSPQAISLSSMKGGLLPISQEAMSVGEPSYYTYNCESVTPGEMENLARAIGPANKVLILRNQGVIVGGESVDEAFMLAKNIVAATETQLQLLPIGLDNILLPTEEVKQQMYSLSLSEPQPVEEGRRKWRRGELQFEAYMRHLDNAGYRTGHIYHEPNLRKSHRIERANSEVEIPPTSSSFAYYDDGKFSSPLKTVLEKQKRQHKTDWLNTPNSYKKEQIEEIGTATPKKITKWVEDKSTAKGSTPVKVENPNQFAPQGENPKELKLKYKEIKKEYYEEKIDAGPQSRILEGTTWEEAQKLNEGGSGDKVIMVGAASKGIIQKDHQHNATVYKTYYAQNPFDSMTEEEISKYQEQVQKGGSGEPVTIVTTTTEEVLEPGPDGKLISTEERMIQIRQGQGDPPQQAHRSRKVYLETSLDDLSPRGTHYVNINNSANTEYSTQDHPPSPGGQSPVVTAHAPQQQKQQQQQPDLVDAAASPQQQKPDSPKKKKAKKPDKIDIPPEDDPEGSLQRSQSARYPEKSPELIEELENQPSFEREKAKSERKPKKKRRSKDVNGEQLASPTKSTSSGDGTLDERSSREGSPSKEALSTDPGSPEKGGEKKKKKFRMPSFSKTKKDKDKKPSKQSAV